MVKIDNENESMARLEAALYSAGRPLSIEDLIRASGTESRTKTLNLLTKLIQKTKSSFKAIEITNFLKGNKTTYPIAFIGSHVQALPLESLKNEKNIDIVLHLNKDMIVIHESIFAIELRVFHNC